MASSSPPPRTVVIAGAGIVGLTAAISLRALPTPPTVIIHERRPEEGALSGPGGIMIQPNGLAALSALADGSGEAVLAALGAVSHPLGRGGFQSATGKDLYIAEPAGVTLGQRTDDVGVSVSRTALMGVLAEAAKIGQPGGVEVVWESAVTSYTTTDGAVDKVDVHVKTAGQAATVRGVDVLIGADGIWSGVRSAVDAVTGRPSTPRHYGGLMWWRGSVSFSAVAARCADVGRLAWGQAWLPRGSSMGYFRIGGDDLAWFASAPRPADEPVDGSPLAEFLAEFGPHRGTTPPVYAAVVDAVAAAGSDTINRAPVYSRGVPVAAAGVGPVWGTGPVTLAGDAAHAIFPSLGQGACMGMEDAAELTAALAAAWRDGRPGGVPAALRSYEAARAPRVSRVGVESARVYDLSALTGGISIWLRDTVYSVLPQWIVDKQFSWLYDYKPTPVPVA